MIWSNVFLVLSSALTTYPCIALIILLERTGLNLRELTYKEFKSKGLFVADLSMFMIHVIFYSKFEIIFFNIKKI